MGVGFDPLKFAWEKRRIGVLPTKNERSVQDRSLERFRDHKLLDIVLSMLLCVSAAFKTERKVCSLSQSSYYAQRVDMLFY